MGQAKHRHYHIPHMHGILVACNTGKAVTRRSSVSGKQQCITDSQLREMSLGFGLVDDFAAETAMHVVPGYAIILHFRTFILVQIEAMGLSCDGFEEGRASAAGH
jgi:hypothetical protein